MKKKIAIFEGKVSPIVRSLPPSVAASIGRTLVRHTYLESLLLKTINNLLEISIKQGRLAVKLPPVKAYPKLIESLLQFHGLYGNAIKFKKIGLVLDVADRARNILAHSIILKEKGRLHIQIVRGSWELDQEAFSVNRALQPETPLLDRAFLTARRAEVERGITAARGLLNLTVATMQALHEKRRTQAVWDRRHHPQN